MRRRRRRRRPPPAHRRRRSPARPVRPAAAARPATGRAAFAFRRSATSTSPSTSTQPPGDHRDLFVVEQTGRVQVVRDGEPAARPFLDLSDQVSCWAASRACSRSPSRPTTGSRGSCTSTTPTPPATRGWSSTAAPRRIRWSPTRRAPARSWAWTSRTRTTTAASSCSAPGPADLLYIGLGDGGSAGRPRPQRPGPLAPCSARSCASTRAPRAGGPTRSRTRNPFVGRSGARPEIYSYGLRNPWRFSFDPATGALAIGDVGQNEFEEVDLVARGEGRGANFGWSAYEGFDRFNDDQQAPDAVPPVLVYGHDAGCSITGGYVVRDRSAALALRPLPVRRLLRRAAAQLHRHARTPRHRRPRARAPGPVAELVRRGRRRPHLRDLARGTRLPAGARASQSSAADRYASRGARPGA